MNYKAINKSLFDYKVESQSTNPRLLINEDKSIESEIKDSLVSCERYDISVAYVVLSGLQRLVDDLQNKPGSRFITTTDGFVTSPAALRVLMDISGTETRVFVPKVATDGFHAKTYMFINKEKSKLFVGSANISHRAFGSVHETAIMTEMTDQGMLFARYKENYEYV